MEQKTLTIALTESLNITFETGAIARQADGAVVVRCGETMYFAPPAGKKESLLREIFFPLRVDYQENFSAVGRTSGGFIKRQGKPSQKRSLYPSDRQALRPMFEEGIAMKCKSSPTSGHTTAFMLQSRWRICGASAALVISDIPLIKPIAGVRVGLINGKFVVNPTVSEQKESMLDLLMAGLKMLFS